MIEQALDEALAQCQLTRNEFSELLVRLLDYGVICRDESNIETLLYDRFQRCEPVMREWIAPLGLRLQHDSRFQFIRVYPPGSEVPGMPDHEEPHHGGFRARLSQQEVAAILVLRVEYDKSLREGKVDDHGCVALTMEALELGLRNLLKMSLPDKLVERKQLLKKLRQLRLIQFNGEDSEAVVDTLLRVRPTIAQFVSESALQQLLNSPQEPDNVQPGEQGKDEQKEQQKEQKLSAVERKAEPEIERITPEDNDKSLFSTVD